MTPRIGTLIVAFLLTAAGIGFAAETPPPHAGSTHPKAAKPATAPKPLPSPVQKPAPQPETDGQTKDQGTLEVTADHDLEWLQQDHAYVARGNAVAKRGTVTLTGDTLIAFYRPLASPPGSPPKPAEPAKAGATPKTGFDSGSTEIWRVIAEGNVHIVSEDRDAWGDRAEYDKDNSVVVLTGQHLKAQSLTDTVTARDSLEYWDQRQIAVARGNALIVKVDGDTLAGDVIAGNFAKNEQNQTILKTLNAKGHMVLTTQTDIVHGDEGTYDLAAKRTVMFGNVHATHGDNELDGESAEVDMVTGISRVFPAPGQRVHALFVRQQPLDKAQQDDSKKKSGKH